MEMSGTDPGFYEWEKMPSFVRRKIEIAVTYAEGYDDTSELPKLNKFLDREGYIGKRALIRTDEMIAMVKTQGNNDIASESVLDPDILGGSQFEGEFVGCGAIELPGTGVHATYDLQFEHDDGRSITIKALVNASMINFQLEEPELDEMDNRIAQAFETLSATNDQDYHEVVTILRESFFDKNQRDGTEVQRAARLRVIGAMSTFLTAHPEHMTDMSKGIALETIIGECIDESCQYIITGKELRYASDSEGRERLNVESILTPMAVDIVNFRYVPNFEIEYLAEGRQKAIIGPEMQAV